MAFRKPASFAPCDDAKAAVQIAPFKRAAICNGGIYQKTVC
jgi:hypothetical protein